MPYIGKSPQQGNYSKLDDFSGDFDGSDATHAIASGGTAIDPITPNALIISINGVLQEPSTDYTVSGSNITFTTAPAAGDNFFGVAMGEGVSIGTPSNSSVTSAKLSGNLVTPGTLDVNGQELILDADADTSITADTDDQIDIKIAGADDFQFTANTFTAQSGSTIAAQALTATSITSTGVVTIPDGSASSPSLTNAGDTNTGIAFPAADTVGITAGGTEQFRFGSNPIPGGSKNSVINGNMLIDQRGSTADMGSANGNTYGGPDRFTVHVQSSPQGRGTVTQDTTVLAGSGQSKSYKFDCTTAESAVASGEEIAIQYRLAGQDIQHWMYGQTNAVTLTLSFDFRSPKSGTHCVAFYALDDNENYIAEFKNVFKSIKVYDLFDEKKIFQVIKKLSITKK